MPAFEFVLQVATLDELRELAIAAEVRREELEKAIEQHAKKRLPTRDLERLLGLWMGVRPVESDALSMTAQIQRARADFGLQEEEEERERERAARRRKSADEETLPMFPEGREHGAASTREPHYPVHTDPNPRPPRLAEEPQAAAVVDSSPPLGEQADAAEGKEEPGPTYSGIGMVLEMKAPSQLVSIVGVHPGSPAERAGVEMGDVLLQVDGAEVATLNDCVARLRGPAGSRVQVSLARGGQGDPVVLELKRAPITVPAVAEGRAPVFHEDIVRELLLRRGLDVPNETIRSWDPAACERIGEWATNGAGADTRPAELDALEWIATPEGWAAVLCNGQPLPPEGTPEVEAGPDLVLLERARSHDSYGWLKSVPTSDTNWKGHCESAPVEVLQAALLAARGQPEGNKTRISRLEARLRKLGAPLDFPRAAAPSDDGPPDGPEEPQVPAASDAPQPEAVPERFFVERFTKGTQYGFCIRDRLAESAPVARDLQQGAARLVAAHWNKGADVELAGKVFRCPPSPLRAFVSTQEFLFALCSAVGKEAVPAVVDALDLAFGGNADALIDAVPVEIASVLVDCGIVSGATGAEIQDAAMSQAAAIESAIQREAVAQGLRCSSCGLGGPLADGFCTDCSPYPAEEPVGGEARCVGCGCTDSRACPDCAAWLWRDLHGHGRCDGSACEIALPPEASSSDTRRRDALLLDAALTQRPGAAERWRERSASGLTDRALREAITAELVLAEDDETIPAKRALDVGIVAFANRPALARGKPYPLVWLAVEPNRRSDSTAMRGARLLKWVRTLYGISSPTAQLVATPSEPPREVGEAPPSVSSPNLSTLFDRLYRANYDIPFSIIETWAPDDLADVFQWLDAGCPGRPGTHAFPPCLDELRWEDRGPMHIAHAWGEEPKAPAAPAARGKPQPRGESWDDYKRDCFRLGVRATKSGWRAQLEPVPTV